MAFPRSGTVDTQTFSGTKDFVFARSSATQSTNIAVGDHLKLDTVDFSRPSVAQVTGALGGSAISLDTTTTYTNTVGAASLGRFSLRGGKLYKLECSPGYVLETAAGSLVTLQWFDVTTLGSPAAIGQPLTILNLADTAFENSTGDLWTMYSPGGGQNDIFLVEVQIIAVTTLISIGAANKGFPTILVETY
jgi:hypothetical protein